MNFNQITLAGNVANDPEMRLTASGKAVTSFNLAINEGPRDNQKTLFVRVSCWEKLAETVSQYLVKGQGVLISGRLDASRAYTRQNGELGASTEVTALTVQFGAKPRGQDGDTEARPAQTAKPSKPEETPDIPF